MGHQQLERQANEIKGVEFHGMDVQKGTCLYCQKSLSQQSQVDHFIPWSSFPADLGHNFVLAHDKCNNAKSDFLAAKNHLAAWIDRNKEHQVELKNG